MTASNRDQRGPAFELARLMRDAEFRGFMKRNGYASGTTVLTTRDDERATDVFSRIVAETEPPVVLAIHRPAAKWGFVFLTIGQAQLDQATGETDDMSDVHGASTIGMLYDAMAAATHRRTKLTVPNDWQPATFQVALAEC